jgi:hypothetical protein
MALDGGARPGAAVPRLPPPDRTRSCSGSPARSRAVARPPSSSFMWPRADQTPPPSLSSLICRRPLKGCRTMPSHPFRPLLLSSLVVHPEWFHPSPSTAGQRLRPRRGRSSLLAGPPLWPHGELRLPRFSAQFPLCSSPPLRVRCCRSLLTSPP